MHTNSLKYVLLFVFFLSSFLSFGQNKTALRGTQATEKSKGAERVVLDQYGDLDFVQFEKGTSCNSVAEFKETLKLPEGQGLKLKSEQVDRLGQKHTKFYQTYNDLRVMGREFVFHGEEGNISSANGKLAGDITVNTKPTLSDEDAFNRHPIQESCS